MIIFGQGNWIGIIISGQLEQNLHDLLNTVHRKDLKIFWYERVQTCSPFDQTLNQIDDISPIDGMLFANADYKEMANCILAYGDLGSGFDIDVPWGFIRPTWKSMSENEKQI